MEVDEKRMTVRMPEALYNDINRFAEADFRSLHNEILVFLHEAVQRRTRADAVEQQAHRDAEQHAKDLDQRARDLDQRARDLDQRAKDAEQRAKDLEQRANDADQRMNGGVS